MISRRGFLAGLGAALAAPAVIRIPGLLMPIRALDVPEYGFIEYSAGYVIAEEEMDFTTDNLIARAVARYQIGIGDWRNVYGTAGT